jgi:hypothetical protein
MEVFIQNYDDFHLNNTFNLFGIVEPATKAPGTL